MNELIIRLNKFTRIEEKLRVICDFYYERSYSPEEIACVLQRYNYFQEAGYVRMPGPDRIRAHAYRPYRIEQEIQMAVCRDDIADCMIDLLGGTGNVYSKTEIKAIMQQAYAIYCHGKKARASELGIFLRYEEMRSKNGTRMIRIIGKY